MTEPFFRAEPGGPILADDWNNMQIRARDEIDAKIGASVSGHTHTGAQDGQPLKGDAIDPNAVLHVKQVVAASSLTVGSGADTLTLSGKSIQATGTSASQDLILTPKGTGGVGIATSADGYRLKLAGSALFEGNYLFVHSESAGRLRIGAAWGMPGLYSSDDGPRDLTLGVPPGRKVYLGTSNTDASVEGGTGNTFFKGDLVAGTVQSRGAIYAGGSPLACENYEIYLCGSALESQDGNVTLLRIASISMSMPTLRGLNTVILNSNGTPKGKTANHDVYADPNQWNSWADWVNQNAGAQDVVAVASYDAVSNAPRGGSAEALLTSIVAVEAFSAEKGSVRSPYALLFVKGGVAIEVSNNYKGPNAQLRTTNFGLISQDRWAMTRTLARMNSPLRSRMYPASPIVYQNIFDAKAATAIQKLGAPSRYDEYSGNTWNDRHIICFGGNDDKDGNGALVKIPPGFDTVWVRVLGDRWQAIKAVFQDGNREDLGIYVGGNRAANCYCPDGSLTDGYTTVHQWLPIPAGRSGNLALVSRPFTNDGMWFSGLAFSRNPWAHATQAAVGYYWKVNGGDATTWADGWHSWNGDSLTKILAKSNLELKVPVIPNGRDKLLYLVEHNADWNGVMHHAVVVNGVAVERFCASYDNPFARHFGSKSYSRYIAARVPAHVVARSGRLMSVNINMSLQNEGIHFRELGTHDFETPCA